MAEKFLEVKVSVLETEAFLEFVARVENFIDEYAWHLRSCSAIDGDGEWVQGNSMCDCGYDEQLRRIAHG
jgi:hypothetical protein